jgi:hypothetical protein
MTINAVEDKHLLGKARDAAIGGRSSWDVQSTGERVAVALVLNRADWLAAMGYTLAEAIGRTGPEWLSLVPEVAKQLVDEGEYPVNDSPN